MTEPSGTDRGAAEPWWQRGEERLESAVGGQARLRVVLVLACVLALNSADLATVGAVAPQLQQSLGIGNIGVGILVSTSTGIGALATIPAGMVIDRSPRVRLLAGAVAVWSIAMIVSGAASSFLMLLLTRLALGAIVATAFPAVASLAGDLFPSAERGRLFGYVLSGELIGVAIGFLISGTLASVSWRLSFWVLAVPGLVFAVALPRLLPEPARGGASRLPPGAGTIHSAGELSWLPPERRPNAETGSGEQGDVAALVERDGVAPHEDLLVRSNPNSWSLREAIRYVLSIPTNRMLIVASALGYFYFAGLRTFAVEYLRNRFDLGQAVASVLLVVLGAG
ncbi:MAG: MFS transporter, partial [Sciscionella sp.]